jgi:hypothetical protein
MAGYLSSMLIDSTLSNPSGIESVWKDSNSAMALWELVIPALSVNHRKAIMTCLRVQQSTVINPRLKTLLHDEFLPDFFVRLDRYDRKIIAMTRNKEGKQHSVKEIISYTI